MWLHSTDDHTWEQNAIVEAEAYACYQTLSLALNGICCLPLRNVSMKTSCSDVDMTACIAASTDVLLKLTRCFRKVRYAMRYQHSKLSVLFACRCCAVGGSAEAIRFGLTSLW